MKQAILITAYENFTWLRQVVEIYRKEAECYIHIDKKTKIPKEFLCWAKETQGVYLYSRYRINWGSYRHISAILLLLKEALKNGCMYMHFLSANTFITKPMKEVLAFFAKDPEKSYLEIIDLAESDPQGNIRPWYIYYHFLHLYDKRTELGNQFDYYLCKLQNRLKMERRLNYRYKGLVYCHLSKVAAEYVLLAIKQNPDYLRQLKTCNIPEEFFFQNLLMNSPYKEQIVPTNLLYDRWDEGGAACFLTEEDYPAIEAGNYLFARKFGKESEELFAKLCKQMDDRKGADL